ncbi:hypothetical protein FQA39_LY01622 [Lamprigera yunnana]|nr:hypothetical protein FQA39_LY01622 [Lamprigera yunnana]
MRFANYSNDRNIVNGNLSSPDERGFRNWYEFSATSESSSGSARKQFSYVGSERLELQKLYKKNSFSAICDQNERERKKQRQSKLVRQNKRASKSGSSNSYDSITTNGEVGEKKKIQFTLTKTLVTLKMSSSSNSKPKEVALTKKSYCELPHVSTNIIDVTPSLPKLADEDYNQGITLSTTKPYSTLIKGDDIHQSERDYQEWDEKVLTQLLTESQLTYVEDLKRMAKKQNDSQEPSTSK